MDGIGGRGGGGDCPTPLTVELLLKDYESHFNWIAAYPLTNEQLVRLRQKVDLWKEEMREIEVAYYSTVSNYLQQLVLDFILGNYTQNTLDVLENTLAAFPREDLPEEHFKAYSYLVMIEKLNIIRRGRDVTGSYKLFQAIKKIDLTDPKTKAAIIAVKSVFFGLLGDVDEKLKHVQQVVELDPESSDWYRLLYYTIRRVRRERDFISAPSDEEVDACQKTYDLGPNISSSFASMAELRHDTLKAFRHSNQTNKLMNEKGIVEISREMIWFARKACDLNPNCIGTNIRLAEMLASNSISREFQDLEASEEQFHFCVKEWPESSHVLHKIGKFYFGVKRDLLRGLDFYKQGLEADSDNYPCLMDYLRALYKVNYEDCQDGSRAEGATYETFVEIIDSKMPLFHIKKVYGARLKCAKAALYWKLGREDESIVLWLDAAIQDPNIVEDDILRVMRCHSVFRDMLNLEDFRVIVEKLNLKNQELEEGLENQPLHSLIDAIKKDMEDWELFQREKANNPNWRQTGTNHKNSKHKNYLKRQMRYLSESDLVDDWRSQCNSSFSDSSSTFSTSTDTRHSSSYPGYYSNHSNWVDRQQNQKEEPILTQNPDRWIPPSRSRLNSTSGDVDGFVTSNLQRSHEKYGSTWSISTNTTCASSTSIGSSFSRSYGFSRPYNRDAYQSECDKDDNWRRK